jgi:PEGA domain-containing protein
VPKSHHRKSLTFILTISTLIVLSTIFVSLLARGYRINLKKGIVLTPTGLISATSTPKSASVFINDRLVTATDDTINLPPGEYEIKISKDGFLTWRKNLLVKKEIVAQTDAHLFRSAPILEPLSLSGAINPQLSPDKNKIVFSVASASATTDNGLYLAELNSNTLPIGSRSTSKLLRSNTILVDWTQATDYQFSPDSSQVIVSFKNANYLIDLNTNLSGKPLYDITAQLPIIQKQWSDLEQEIIKTKLQNVPEQVTAFISTESSSHVQPYNSKDKVLYLATISGQLENNIITPPPSQSDQPQQRQIEAGNYYIYDIKQDTNFLIGSTDDIKNPFWLPASNHIIFIQDDQIKVMEYDNTNLLTLFAGDFDKNLVAPLNDGQKLVTLTSAYLGAQPNLYTIGIR